MIALTSILICIHHLFDYVWNISTIIEINVSERLENFSSSLFGFVQKMYWNSINEPDGSFIKRCKLFFESFCLFEVFFFIVKCTE